MESYGAPPPYPSGAATGFASSTTTADTELLRAPGKGLAYQITMVVIDNAHATTKTSVTLKSGSTAKTGAIPAPAAGGAVLRFDPPLPFGDNEAVNFAALAGVTTITVTVHGYVSARAQ